jgi:hypothetical protein
MADTDKVVLMSSTVTLASTLAATMLPKGLGGKGQFPSARLLVGSSMAFMGLSILGMGAPRLATGLSITMATTAMMYYGIPLADNFFNPSHHNATGPAASVETTTALAPVTINVK